MTHEVKGEADRFEDQRRMMVQYQIAARGIRDERVLAAMRAVPRHLFVPPGMANEAYNDYPLPIGQGQTISQPYIVAEMTELLALTGEECVLEIGTGSGYQAAILSLLAREVYTIEFVETLADSAAERLRSLGYVNVQVRFGDGSLGWAEAAPFDGIVVTAAAPALPQVLKTQLKQGGRLVIPLDDEFGDGQTLMLYHKESGKLKGTSVEGVRFVPMRGEVEEQKQNRK